MPYSTLRLLVSKFTERIRHKIRKTRRQVRDGTSEDKSSGDKSTEKRSEAASATIPALPPEILCEIFLYCLPIDHDQCSIFKQSQAPSLLGRVCSRWRTVSISSPHLWSRFAIVDRLNQTSGIDHKKAVEATKLWISRSASHPLSIFIHYPQYAPILQPVFASILSESWRWKDINMVVSSEIGSLILATFRLAHLPHLENFRCAIFGEALRERPLIYNFSSAPRLQLFHHHRTPGVQIDFGSRVHHVKSLRIAYPPIARIPGTSFSDVLTCLTHCPLLEEFFFSVSESWTSRQEVPTVIELLHLRVFILRLLPNINPGFLFDILFLPALIHVEIVNDVYEDDRDWPHLRTMLARSRPPLQSLVLYSIPMNEQTLAECLSYTPSLALLSIPGTKCTDTTLDLLTVGGNDSFISVCPCLETIRFGPGSQFSSSAMMAMILSRQTSVDNPGIGDGKGLKSVFCTSRIVDNIAGNPDIARCMQNGLRLYTIR
ncbi:hypothetical protein BD410DRAFT_789686 [Rickenella mellea]|uniref:Uncharacterized protein n=1 Tax=Rickenella mellea TaxID=50990 RepID=A0A4Y7Q2B6_9AGAM|nr:hypothetical protein BD410DRAFT_789686 [Rickenella mellea]